MILFAIWAWFILGAYVFLLVAIGWRRFRGGNVAPHGQLITVSDHETRLFQGAPFDSLSGLLVVTSSFFWGTFGAVVCYGAVGMLCDLQTDVWSPIGTALMAEIALAVLFLVWCAWNAGGRWGVIVDRPNMSVTTWWGVVVPFVRKSFPVKDFSAVTIRPKRKRFVVQLEGNGRPVLLDKTVCRSHEAAHQLATLIATAGGWELRDHTQN